MEELSHSRIGNFDVLLDHWHLVYHPLSAAVSGSSQFRIRYIIRVSSSNSSTLDAMGPCLLTDQEMI